MWWKIRNGWRTNSRRWRTSYVCWKRLGLRVTMMSWSMSPWTSMSQMPLFLKLMSNMTLMISCGTCRPTLKRWPLRMRWRRRRTPMPRRIKRTTSLYAPRLLCEQRRTRGHLVTKTLLTIQPSRRHKRKRALRCGCRFVWKNRRPKLGRRRWRRSDWRRTPRRNKSWRCYRRGLWLWNARRYKR